MNLLRAPIDLNLHLWGRSSCKMYRTESVKRAVFPVMPQTITMLPKCKQLHHAELQTELVTFQVICF